MRARRQKQHGVLPVQHLLIGTWLNVSLRLQGKQLLPTNHPSLLETGFSPPPPCVLPPFSPAPPCFPPRTLCAAERGGGGGDGGGRRRRGERAHVFLQSCLVKQWSRAACACHPPTLPTGVGFMWLPACPDNAPMEEEEEEECVKLHQQQLCQLA